MRTRVALASLLALSLSIISTTFTLLATTSKSWGTQAYYFDNGTELGLTELSPVCVYERSPFYRCGLPRVNIHGVCNITECAYYRPYGYDKTSCRSATEYGRIWSENVLAKGLLGMSQECQEGQCLRKILLVRSRFADTENFKVHYAGNLQIAASVFLGLGLLSTLMLVMLLASATMYPRRSATSGAASQQYSEANKTTDASEPPTHAAPASDEQAAERRFQSHSIPYVVTFLLTCLYAGILTQILAQYFGVLGLTINATPNAASARDAVGFTDSIFFQADSWAIGKGLSTYATTAWASAVACVALVTTMFRGPRWPKVH